MVCNIDQSNKQISQREDTKLDLPDGVPPLYSLYLYISESCNLACQHCWISPSYNPGNNGGKQVELDWVRKAVREARPLGLQNVKLTGGEPLLHTEFRELVNFIDGEGLEIHMETNGTLIDNDLAKFLKQKEHLSFISVSLDGSDDETHESLRRVPGSFKKAIQGIVNLVEQGFQPQLVCTLHKGNISQLNEVIQLAGDLGCGSVKFNHVQEVGRGEQFAKQQGLKIYEIINIYRRLEKDYSTRSGIPIHFDIPFAFYSIRRLLDEDLSSCTIKNILGLLAGGELSLCGIGITVPEMIFGRIENDDLHAVWCHSPGLIQLREKIPDALEGICFRCLHRDLCQGTCVANNYHATGRLNAGHRFCQIADEMGLFPDSRKKYYLNSYKPKAKDDVYERERQTTHL